MPDTKFSKQREEIDELTQMILEQDEMVKRSYEELIELRGELIRLGKDEAGQRLLDLESQKEAIDRYATYAVESELEISQARREIGYQTAEAIANQWVGQVTTMANVTRTTLSSALNSISGQIANGIVDQTQDWKKAMQGLLKVMIQMLIKMVAMKMVMAAISAATGGAGGVLGGALGLMHSGGMIMHKGGAVPQRYHSGALLSRNEVPAILERGEFIINRRAVARPGVMRTLTAINSGRNNALPPIVNETHHHYNFSINAIDAENMEEALHSRIIPALEDAERRGAYSPGSSNK